MTPAGEAVQQPAAATPGGRLYDLVLAAVVVYLPYEQHYSVVLPLKGLNLINLMFLVVLAMVLSRRGRDTPATPLKGRFVAFIVALVLAFLVGQAYDPSRFADDLTVLKNDVFYMLFYFLFYHAVRDERSIRVVFAAILFVTFLVALQGVRQALDYGISGGYNPTRRVTGPFGAGTVQGANLASAFYVIFTPVAFTVALLCRSRPWVRLAAAGISVFSLFAAFFTYSRQAYVALAALFLLQSIRRSIFVGVLVLLAVASYGVWAPDAMIERIEMTTEGEGHGAPAGKPAEGGEEVPLDQSTASRFMLWEGGMTLFAGKPWGIGLARFRREIGSVVPSYAGFDAHNGFVLITTECGILGITTLVWLLLGLVVLARRVEKLDGEEDTRVLGSAFMVALLGVCFTNLFGSRFFNGEIMANFWILAGVAARYYTLKRARAASAGQHAQRHPGQPVQAGRR